MKKYKLTNKTRKVDGITLYQIQALTNFSDVKAGDLGGWIESESNLAQEGDCWVYDNALVFNNARVYDNAKVYGYGKAEVYDDAKVYDNALVHGNAKVYGKAEVFDYARVFGFAWVYGDAGVYGDAKVSGNARVYGDAAVSGNAWVYDNAWVYGKAKVFGNRKIGGSDRIYENINKPISKNNSIKKSELKQLIIEVLLEKPEEKDKQRIKDLFTKSKGSDDKLLQLASNMAKSIDDPQKALRRGEAVDFILGPEDNELAKIFYDRAKELGTEKLEANPKIDKTKYKGGVIFLPTFSAMTLWANEITGQLSDGYWENTRPYDHWEFWCDLNVQRGQPETKAGEYKWPRKTSYGLTSSDLLDAVGDRMIAGAKLSKAINKLLTREEYYGAEYFLSNDAGADRIKSIDDYQKAKPKDYKLKYLQALDENMIQKFFNTKYEKSDLIRDLQLIKVAMHNITH